MARPVKKVVQEEVLPTFKQVETDIYADYVANYLKDLEERVAALEKKLEKPIGPSIQRVEKFNDEVPSTIESYNGMKMEASDRIISMQNAIKILPPNMIDAVGRHLKENVEAICGFKVSDEMMDEAYRGLEYDTRGN